MDKSRDALDEITESILYHIYLVNIKDALLGPVQSTRGGGDKVGEKNAPSETIPVAILVSC